MSNIGRVQHKFNYRVVTAFDETSLTTGILWFSWLSRTVLVRHDYYKGFKLAQYLSRHYTVIFMILVYIIVIADGTTGEMYVLEIPNT